METNNSNTCINLKRSKTVIVDTMDYAEICRLWKKDNDGIVSHKAQEQAAKLRRKMLASSDKGEATMPPVMFKSASGFTFWLMVCCKSRGDAKKFRFGKLVFAWYLTARGFYTIANMLEGGCLRFWIFTPHFFDRYRERFLKDMTLEKEAVIQRFLETNYNMVKTKIASSKYPNSHYLICQDGVCLCNDYSSDILLIKTFLSWDMLGEDQAVVANEGKAIREEMVATYNLGNRRPLFYMTERKPKTFVRARRLGLDNNLVGI